MEIYLATNYCSFFFSWKIPEEASSIQKIFCCLWKWTNRPKEDWQRTTWLNKICVEDFGAIPPAFLNHTAHLGFFPNSILITCSQIVVFQTACSFIMEPAVSDSIIESYIVYRNWYSEYDFLVWSWIMIDVRGAWLLAGKK